MGISEKLLPGTIINATAVYKVTDDFTIKDTIQIRVSCKASDVTYKIGADGTVTLRCTGVLSSFKGITVDGKALIQGKIIQQYPVLQLLHSMLIISNHCL